MITNLSFKNLTQITYLFAIAHEVASLCWWLRLQR